jgi:type I restriction enzyme M protein
MDALIENNELFSTTENTVAVSVLAVNEQVKHPSIKETVEHGSRLLLRCFNMIRNIERIQSEAAFDEVCKLLLIVVLKDKQEIEHFDTQNIDTEYAVQSIFDSAKRQHIYSIFEESDRIKITVSTFKQVLWELSHFNWADDNARKLVFEEFLTGISRNNPELITTPQQIIDYMVDILDPKEGDRICDPCCGNGGFLIKSFDYINQSTHESHKADRLAFYIYGVDINEIAVRNFKMRLFIHNIEGTNVYKADGLFNANGIEENKFDIVLAQPPFGVRSDIYNDLRSTYPFYQNHRQLDFVFIQRCLDLLKDGGKMGIIVREGLLFENSNSAKTSRRHIESQAKILQIISLPISIFSTYAGVKTSIIFLQKKISKEKETLDYKVLFADIKDIGISLKAKKAVNNELILLAKEYKNALANPEIGNQTLLKETPFDEMSNWSLGYLTNIDIERNEKYNYQKLSSFLVKNTNAIKINDLEEYKRVTVKFNNEVILRDRIMGIEIGTKKQFRIAKGQLIVAKIGANNGALGIVPDELDNAIVTADFLTYTIDTNKILPEYLVLLLSDGRFTKYFLESSTGSVMRRLNEDLLLNIEIPIPTLSEQIELSKKIIDLRKQLESLTKDLNKEETIFKNTLFES